MRIGDEKRAHDGSDRSTRTQVGNRGGWAGRDLRRGRREATQEIENEIPTPTHEVFDFRSEGPQEDHVAEDMRPAAVHEHRRQNRDQVTPGDDVRRVKRPRGHEGVATRQLEQEDNYVDRDDRRRNDGYAVRTS